MILNFYLPRGYVKSNVQSIGYIISFRIYDTCFHHDVRGHGTRIMLPRSMRVHLFLLFFFLFCFVFFSFFVFFFFLDFPTDFLTLFLPLSLSSYFPVYCAFISYFCFGLACFLRLAGLLKVKVDFQNSIFQAFFGI